MTIADLYTETRALVDADSVSLVDATILRRINAAYEEVIGKLIKLDKNWQFGDSNYSSLPTGLKDLVAGTQAYAFDSTLLTIFGAAVEDNGGLWNKLDLVDEMDILRGGTDLAEYEKTNGLPRQYAKRENFIVLYPAPAAANVTITNGLKVYFQRTADVFTAAQVTTGTKTPGFASPYHVLLAYKAALPYAMSYKKDRVAFIMSEIGRLEKEMVDFYSTKGKDERPNMTMSCRSFR